MFDTKINNNTKKKIQTNLSKNLSRKPDWLKKKINWANDNFINLRADLQNLRLNTVCSAARCPNICECHSHKETTFLILGNICTRVCKFCNISSISQPTFFDFKIEKKNILKFVEKYNYKYVTITSVTRDDLPDFGVSIFRDICQELKKRDVLVELLIPDLNGNINLLKQIISAKPAVINHNIEMPESLYPIIRPNSDFKKSIKILEKIKEIDNRQISKSGFMLGLGETENEVIKLIEILAKIQIDILTIGQYLAPSKKHWQVKQYLPESKFIEYKNLALAKGIKLVLSAPFMRSSYKAFESYKYLQTQEFKKLANI